MEYNSSCMHYLKLLIGPCKTPSPSWPVHSWTISPSNISWCTDHHSFLPVHSSNTPTFSSPCQKWLLSSVFPWCPHAFLNISNLLTPSSLLNILICVAYTLHCCFFDMLHSCLTAIHHMGPGSLWYPLREIWYSSIVPSFWALIH